MVPRGGKIKVLFVSSGRMGDVGYVVRNQGESLIRHGIEIEYFTIKPGLAGYLLAISRIRGRVRNGKFDLVHAHYSFSAFSASLAGSFPMVVSLMGSDAWHGTFFSFLIRLFARLRWKSVILKTVEMKDRLKLPEAHVIPNGVDTQRFMPADMHDARMRLGLSTEKKLIVFISGANRPEKNLPLAREAVARLGDDSVMFYHVHDTDNNIIPLYLNAADLLLLTSDREGGVNVIKEAMSCNCPVVATDVGDVRMTTNDTEGCYVTGNDPGSVAEGIRTILNFNGRTNGREKIFTLGLDSDSVARKIISVYRSVLEGGNR